MPPEPYRPPQLPEGWMPAQAGDLQPLAASFDLRAEPWLPAALLEGRVPQSPQLWGLKELLRRAGGLSPINTGVPECDFMVTRFLGALLRAALPGATAQHAAQWLQAGRFDDAALAELDAYLEEYAQEFDLFGERPFLQAPLDLALPGATARWVKSALVMYPHLFGSTNTGYGVRTWVEERPGHSGPDKLHVLTPAEAAIGLINLRSVAAGGLQHTLFTSHFQAPFATKWHAYVRGRTLLEGLMVQLLATPYVEGDTIPWEHPESAEAMMREFDRRAASGESKAPAEGEFKVRKGAELDRLATGPIECALWQARRVRLLPQQTPDGAWVVAQVLMEIGEAPIGNELGPYDPNLLRAPAAERKFSLAWVGPDLPAAWQMALKLTEFDAPAMAALRELSQRVPGFAPSAHLIGLALNQAKFDDLFTLEIHTVIPTGAPAAAAQMARGYVDAVRKGFTAAMGAAYLALNKKLGQRSLPSEFESRLNQLTERHFSALLRALSQPGFTSDDQLPLFGTLAQGFERDLRALSAEIWYSAQGNPRLQEGLLLGEVKLTGTLRRARARLGLTELDASTPGDEPDSPLDPEQSAAALKEHV